MSLRSDCTRLGAAWCSLLPADPLCLWQKMNFTSLKALPGKVQLTRMNRPWGLASRGWREGRGKDAHLERGYVVFQGHSKIQLYTCLDSQGPNLKVNCWCWTETLLTCVVTLRLCACFEM